MDDSEAEVKRLGTAGNHTILWDAGGAEGPLTCSATMPTPDFIFLVEIALYLILKNIIGNQLGSMYRPLGWSFVRFRGEQKSQSKQQVRLSLPS